MTSPLYIVARTVLLDALDALGEQRDAVDLVSAQAIYLHTGDADIAVPAFTTDGDLVIEPSPPEGRAEVGRGDGARPFPARTATRQLAVDARRRLRPHDHPHRPARAGGRGRRAARLGDHGDRVGRRARGLEGALVEYSLQY